MRPLPLGLITCALLGALTSCASTEASKGGDGDGDGDRDRDRDREPSTVALDDLNQNLMLMQLDEDAEVQLCEAAQAEAHGLYEDEAALRGACLPQAASVAQVVSVVFSDDPDDELLEYAELACEDELERCMTEGVRLASCGPLPAPCGARIADYRECIESVLTVPEQISTITCEQYVRDADARAEIATVFDEAVAPCRDALAFCSDPTAWEDHAIDTVLTDTPDDLASNEDWTERAQEVADAQRPSCDALTRDEMLDELAMTIAEQPFGTTITIDVEATTEWKSILAPRVEIVLARLRSFLALHEENCRWLRYGVDVHGEPGEARHAVLVIAE